jgi:hypothetical protein
MSGQAVLSGALARILLLLIALAGSGFVAAAETNASDHRLPGKSWVRVQLSPLGCFLLPKNAIAYQDVWVDVWAGYVEMKRNRLRIDYAGGLVQSPFSEKEEMFLWTKTERFSGHLLIYGRLKPPKTSVIVARIELTDFYVNVMDENDVNLFLRIVRTFQPGACGRKPLSYSFWNKGCRSGKG